MAWRVGRTHRGGHGALHGGKPSHSFAKLGGRLAVQIEEGVTEALSLLVYSLVGADLIHLMNAHAPIYLFIEPLDCFFLF